MVYALRVNLSVALVAMVNHTAIQRPSTANSSKDTCNTLSDDTDNATALKDGKFAWDQEQQGVILGSFFYSYIVAQIPAGWIAARVGGKWVFGIGVLWTAILTMLTEFAAEAGFGWLVALRILEGLGEGVTFPAMHTIFSKWAPPLERSKLPTFTYAGAFVGTVVAFVGSAYLAASTFLGGWPSAFYVFGLLGCVWFALWSVLVTSGPEEHRWISEAEKDYITKALAGEAATQVRGNIPWVNMMTSLPVWAVIVSHTSHNWGFYTLLTELPSYLRDILRFDIKNNGLLSSLPYVCQAIVQISTGQVADLLRSRLNMRTSTLRKLVDCTGHLVPGLCVLAVGFVGCNRVAAVALLTLAIGSSGLNGAGYMINYLDIAPKYSGLCVLAVGFVGCNRVAAVALLTLAIGSSGLNGAGYLINLLDSAPRYSGILFGISNTAATLPGIFGPYLVGSVTNENSTLTAWRTVFLVTAAIYLFSVVFYFFFGSGSIQPWADPTHPLEVNKSSGALVDQDQLSAADSDFGASK